MFHLLFTYYSFTIHLLFISIHHSNLGSHGGVRNRGCALAGQSPAVSQAKIRRSAMRCQAAGEVVLLPSCARMRFQSPLVQLQRKNGENHEVKRKWIKKQLKMHGFILFGNVQACAL